MNERNFKMISLGKTLVKVFLTVCLLVGLYAFVTQPKATWRAVHDETAKAAESTANGVKRAAKATERTVKGWLAE
ncbi:MAG: hypothetical protein Q8O94_04330 [bacterium]|nr:hypothetical protein [bacterium]